MKFPAIRVDLRIALLYALFGGLWIVFSDRFLFDHITDASTLTTMQTYKGWLFVACSALLIYVLLRRHLILRQVAERSLHESEERYRSLLQNSLDAILLTVPDGSILSANPAACAMFRMPEEMICSLGRNGIVDLTDPRLAVLLEERRRTGLVKGELTMVRNGGEKFPAEMTSSVFTDSMGNNRTSMIIRDISERKRAEEALYESEERYRTLITFSPEAIYVHVNGIVTLVNPAMCRLLGADTPSQLVGKSVFEILAPEYHEIVRKRWELVFRGKLAPLLEEQFIRLDGTRVDVEVNAVAIDLKEYKEVQVVARDITERKQAEETLRQSEHRFHSALDNMMEGCQILGNDWQYLYINDAAAVHNRRPKEELLGKRFKDVWPGIEKTQVFAIVRRSLEERVAHHVEIEFVFPSGDAGWFEMSIQPVPEGVFILSMDITGRKQAEERLQLSEHNLAEAERIGNTGSWKYDVASDTASWSENMFRIFDVDPAMPKELVFKHFVENLVHPDDRTHILSVFQDALAGKRPYDLEYRVVKRDGSMRDIHALAETLRDEHGKAIGMIGKVEDITERKRAEEAIRSSHEQLRALSGYLQQVREEERTMIAREIHDELGQQLTALKMDLAWVHKRLRAADVLAEKTASILARLDTTIHTVRKIATELRPGILDDLGLVAALEWQAKEFQSRSGITCTLTSDVEEVVLDSARSTALFRIFQESLTNVARHSGATRVTARLHQADDTLTMEISDNGKGIGIPAKSGQRTFGLLGMQERAILLGGMLEFLETPRGGTTVLVKIPLQSQLRGM